MHHGRNDSRFVYIFQLFVYIFSAICLHFVFAGGVLFPGTDHIDQWNKIIGKYFRVEKKTRENSNEIFAYMV